jgi:hypothetical protein
MEPDDMTTSDDDPVSRHARDRLWAVLFVLCTGMGFVTGWAIMSMIRMVH